MKDFIEFRDPGNVVPPVSGKQFIIAYLGTDVYRSSKMAMLIKTPDNDAYNWFGADTLDQDKPYQWNWEDNCSKINFLIKSYNYWSNRGGERIVRMFIVNAEEGLQQIFSKYDVKKQTIDGMFQRMLSTVYDYGFGGIRLACPTSSDPNHFLWCLGQDKIGCASQVIYSLSHCVDLIVVFDGWKCGKLFQEVM